MEEKIPVHEIEDLAPSEVSELDLYQKREKIYTRKIEGTFQKLRLFTGWPLLCGYFFMPWVQWNGRQAVLFDLPARKFHVFSITFWPQDFSMLAWVLAIAAFALFLFTTLFGRVWCGYSCPQTVWTSIFMWIEQKTEGSRNQRIKLDQSPWRLQKFVKKLMKHGLWMGFALFTGFTFVGYFSPVNDLIYDLATFSAPLAAVSWVIFFTLATYINAGWMREQVCMYMCPYARFQSAMFDSNTLIVSYDAKRGEQRGSRKRGEIDRSDHLGDCIDCELCKQVCPTGIDIRDGLQYQCIGCALCVDACNSVMEKMGYAKNLISYTTENKLAGKPGKILRFKVVGYTIALIVMCSLLGFRFFTRTPLQIDIIRDRGQLYFQTSDGRIENSYTLKIINMDQQKHDYTLSASGLEGLEIRGKTSISVNSGEVLVVPVRLSVKTTSLGSANSDIIITVQGENSDKLKTSHTTRFLGPAPSL
ncbi:MAG: cytochrome c oxidase accessory protein CcoG [Pseudomonadales bacterium]|nr:cytochrome c oxidase accessory protein CcoG [Pseudomonadales bacterium]